MSAPPDIFDIDEDYEAALFNQPMPITPAAFFGSARAAAATTSVGPSRTKPVAFESPRPPPCLIDAWYELKAVRHTVALRSAL